MKELWDDIVWSWEGKSPASKMIFKIFFGFIAMTIISIVSSLIAKHANQL